MVIMHVHMGKRGRRRERAENLGGGAENARRRERREQEWGGAVCGMREAGVVVGVVEHSS